MRSVSSAGTGTFRFPASGPSDPWINLDGRLAAPTGTPQFPTLLDGYVARPPWRVAGVDYRTGISTGVTLKIPGVDSPPANVTIDSGSSLFNVNGTTTVDGWDFTGWQCLVHAGTPIVTNCDFTLGGLKWLSGEAGNGGTIKYCVFDQTGDVAPPTALITIQRPGIYVIQYNWWNNSYHMHLQISDADVGTRYDMRFNVFSHAGLGHPFGAHGDFIQLFGGGQIDELINRFNMVYQNVGGGATTQGWSFNKLDPRLINGGFTEYCTHVIQTDCNYINMFNAAQQFDQYFVRNNYIDPSSLSGAWLNTTFDGEGAGPFAGVVTNTGNINMVTGGAIT